MKPTSSRPAAPLLAATLALAVLAVAACGPGGIAPSPTPAATIRPTPTPIAAAVASPEDAATLVIASNPIFAGTEKQDPEVIGASKWWTATPTADGGYQVEITVGWGDCMAGCIDRHVWTYLVKPDGAIELIAEQGDDVPSDLPA
jgi:hypothetical protein